MFDAIGKQWQTLYGPLGQAIPASNTDSGTPQYGATNFGDLGYTPDAGDFMGSGGLNDKFLSNLGWTGGNPYINAGAGQTTDGGQAPGADGGYTPEFQKFLQDKGLNFQTSAGPDGHTILGAFGQDGNQVGTNYLYRPVNEDAFLGAAGAATGFAGAAASGAFAGSGAFGSGAGSAGSVLPTGGGITADQAAYGALENGAAYGGGAGDSLVASSEAGLPGGSLPAEGGGGLSSTDLSSLYGNAGYGAPSAGGGLTSDQLAYGALENGVQGGGAGSPSLLNQASSFLNQNRGLTNIGGGLLNGLIGAYSSNKALNAQQNATNQANALLKPYSDTGVVALGRLNGLMTNPGSITTDPGYQFQLQQGQQGLDRSAAGKGNLYSGATLKANDRFNQDYASNALNQAYTRYGGVAQLGATGTTNMSNNLTNLGNAGAGAALYQGNVAQNGVNNALGQFNFSNGGYGGQNPFNQSTYADPNKKYAGP